MVYEPYHRSRLVPPSFDQVALWQKTAHVLGLSREAKQRLEWMIWYYQKAGENGALVCRHFGLHRNTFTKWLKRFDPANLRRLESESRRPKNVRHRRGIPLHDDRIIALRKAHPCWGKMKLKTLYRTIHGSPITSWYIQRVIEAYHLNRPPATRRQNHPKSAYTKKKITELKEKLPVPGFLLHFDSIVLHLFGVKRYILTSVDHHARLGYAWMYRSHASRAAEDFLLRMRYLIGSKIQNIHTDNGSEFHKHFLTAAEKLDMTQYWSRPKTPKDNPMNERFNRTLKEEFLKQGNFHPDPALLNPKLTQWLIEYNSVRPHQALGYLTPLAYAQRSMVLHTMWSSST